MIISTTFMPVERNGEKGMCQGFVGEDITIMWKEFFDNIWSFIPLLLASNYVFLFLFFGGEGWAERKITLIFLNLFLIFSELLRFCALLPLAGKWLGWISWNKWSQCHMCLADRAHIIHYLGLVMCSPVWSILPGDVSPISLLLPILSWC